MTSEEVMALGAQFAQHSYEYQRLDVRVKAAASIYGGWKEDGGNPTSPLGVQLLRLVLQAIRCRDIHLLSFYKYLGVSDPAIVGMPGYREEWDALTPQEEEGEAKSEEVQVSG